MTKKLKLSSLKADLKKEREGDWIASMKYPGVEYLARSIHFPAYVEASRQAGRNIAQQVQLGAKLNEDELQAEDGRNAASHLLLGWRGVDIEYTPEEAMSCFTDVAFRYFLADFLQVASRVGVQQVAFIEADEKN